MRTPSLSVLFVFSAFGLAYAQTAEEGYSGYKQMKGEYKAFAVSPSAGAWGRATGNSAESAKRDAIRYCNRYVLRNDCAVYYLGNKQLKPLRAKRSYSAVVNITGDDGKKLVRTGKIVVENILSKSSSVTVVSNNGDVICTGAKTYIGNKNHQYKAKCFGKVYTGVVNTRSPSYTIHSTGGGKMDVRVSIR
jgi:hypothetical protein